MTLTGLEVSQTWRFELKHRTVFVYLQTRRSHDMCVCFDLQSPSCTLSVRPLWRLYASLCVSSLTQTLNLQLHHCWIGDVGVSPSASRSQSPTLMCGQIINSLFSSFSFSLSTPCSLFLWQVTWTCRPESVLMDSRVSKFQSLQVGSRGQTVVSALAIQQKFVSSHPHTHIHTQTHTHTGEGSIYYVHRVQSLSSVHHVSWVDCGLVLTVCLTRLLKRNVTFDWEPSAVICNQRWVQLLRLPTLCQVCVWQRSDSLCFYKRDFNKISWRWYKMFWNIY